VSLDREKVTTLFFFILLVLIAYELYAVVSPFLSAIIWAILLAFIAHPVLSALDRQIKRRSLSALVITLVVALLVGLPTVWLSARLVTEAQSLYKELSPGATKAGLARATDWVRGTGLGARINGALAAHGIRLEDAIRTYATDGAKQTSEYIVLHMGDFAGNFALSIFHLSIALIAFFYFLRDGESYYETMRELTPLHEEDKQAIFESLSLTLSAVMRGLLLVAVLDGAALGLGYFVLGVPYWVLLALVSAATALLPMGGTAIVWAPLSGYLLATNGWFEAVALVVWAIFVLTAIDNIVKPLVMGHGTGLPTLALFLGLAGGIEAYGPLGIFAGPAVMAVFASLLRVYRRNYGPENMVPREDDVSAVPKIKGTGSRRAISGG
jgi:predicted PurR-regulated permease PerM